MCVYVNKYTCMYIYMVKPFCDVRLGVLDEFD